MLKSFRIFVSLVFALNFAESSFAKVIEARQMRWWGGAPACLDIPDRDAHAGQRLQLYPCHNEPNQNFSYDERNGFLKSYQANQCIDLENGIVNEGQRIALYNCWDGDPQKFRYEASSGLIRYRHDEAFCLALNDDLEGLHLARCQGGNVLQTFEIKNGFGERRLDEVTWATTHNAHVSWGEASWVVPNQSRSIEDQLKDGIRGFMIDTYSRDGDIHLCHGDCNGIPGFGYASPRQTFSGVLDTVTRYMKAYPDVIVTLLLEDYSDPNDMRALLDRSPAVRELLFNPYEEKVRDRGWPTLNDMIARNKRLLIISDKPNKKDLGIGYGKDLTIENYWSLGGLGKNTECKRRWEEIPMDVTYGAMKPLFVMNQFRDIPTLITAAIDNSKSKLLSRVEDKCLPAVKRKPTYVAVDFYESANRGVFKTVETLNQTVAALFENDQYNGHSQLLQPGEYNTDHLHVGNDKTTSILVFRHGAVDAFEHDGFVNWLGRFEASSSNIGEARNDRISSVRVEYR